MQFVPPSLLSDLRRQGYTVRAEGGRVWVYPGSQLSEAERAAIAAHRDALLGLLAVEAELSAHPLVSRALAVFQGAEMVGARLPTGEAWRVDSPDSRR